MNSNAKETNLIARTTLDSTAKVINSIANGKDEEFM